jgi:uncharacterized protein DUF2878
MLKDQDIDWRDGHMGAAIAYFAGFQLVWFACVLGAAAGRPWLGPLAAALYVAGGLGASRQRGAEARLVLLGALLGAAADSALVAAGRLRLVGTALEPTLVPAWMIALWAALAVLLRPTFGWLRGRPALAALLGALAGPLSYAGGGRLGAAEILAPWPASAAAIALEWTVALPLLVHLAFRPGGDAR